MVIDVLNMFNYQINNNELVVGLVHSYYEAILSGDNLKNSFVLYRKSLGVSINKIIEVSEDGQVEN